jgi:hypothetical protein
MLSDVILEGLQVLDPAARSEDLAYFFEDEDEKEEDDSDDLRTLIWVEVDVPVPLFGCNFTMNELAPVMLDPECLNDEREREAKILAWVEAKGGWQKALKESPVLAIVLPDGLAFVDGWHRVKLARQSGQTIVRALIGVREL